ncbi:MAG: Ead/Ea22-like protein [Microvirga sp.]|nr:Ead/Ea22-like protein [Microvirga sp.]
MSEPKDSAICALEPTEEPSTQGPVTIDQIAEMRRICLAATEGEWWAGPTPFYLTAGQVHQGKHPLTIRSPAHTEEIATVWTCLLPVEANAEFIATFCPGRVLALLEEIERLSGRRVGGGPTIDAEMAVAELPAPLSDKL